MTKSIYLGLAAVAAITIAGCGSKGGDSSTIAMVGNKPITADQYRKYLENKGTVMVTVQGQNASLPVSAPLGYQALEDLISQKILLQMAEDEGVAPKSEDVDAEIAFRTKLNPGFVNQQTSAGITLQQIKDALLVQLAQERLLTKGITVTMPEVEDYIKKNPKQFEDPATAELQWVVVKDEATKAKVDQALTTGQDFQKVALTYSIDPNLKQNGGKFPQTRIDQMVEPIRKAVEATPTGKQTAWIKFNDGQAKFLVEKKEAAKPTTISEAQKQYVQRQLAMQRGKMANDLDKRLRDKLKETKITVDYEPLKPMWAKTEEQLKKSATSNVTTGGGGATTGDIPAGTTGPATTGK